MKDLKKLQDSFLTVSHDIVKINIQQNIYCKISFKFFAQIFPRR